MRILSWILLVALFFSVSVARAQEIDLSKTYTYDSGTVFKYPSDWSLADDPKYLVDVYSPDTIIYFADFSYFQSGDMTKDDTLTDVLRSYFGSFYPSLRFLTNDIQDIEIGGREAVRYDFVVPDGKLEAFILVIRFSDSTFGLMEANSSAKNFPEEDIVLAIAATFDVSETASSAAATAEVSCVIRTDVANTVRIRVGPGNNRTSFAFLPADEDFDVLGKASAKDGSLWFKLDKEAVAPGKSAAEAWIAAKDVDSTGNCDAVVDVNAPPVIPIVSAPPPSSGGSDTTESSAGATIPRNGTWTVTFSHQTNASCEGMSNVVLNTSEVWIDWTEADFVQQIEITGASQDSLVFNGGLMQNTGDNHYSGSTTFEDGKNTQIYLTVLSPTSMVGQMIGNVRDSGGVACSATVDLTATTS
jgi:hypothetical protein